MPAIVHKADPVTVNNSSSTQSIQGIVKKNEQTACVQGKLPVYSNIYMYLNHVATDDPSADEQMDITATDVTNNVPTNYESVCNGDLCETQPLYFNKLIAREFKRKQHGRRRKRHKSVFLHDDYEYLPYNDCDIMTLNPDQHNDKQDSDGQACEIQDGRQSASPISSCDNNLIIQAGNISTTALVDTGATISCISSELLQKIHPKFLNYQESDLEFIYGVGNKQHEVTAKVAIKLSINGRNFTQSFYALHNQYSIILGMDFITANKAKLDFENSTITLNGLSCKLQSPPLSSTLVKSAQDSFIPPHTAQDISISLAKQLISPAILLEPVSSLQRKFNGLDLVDSIVSAQHTVCRVANSTEEPIVIPKGTIVAMARNISVSVITEPQDFVTEPQEPDCTEDSPQELSFDVAPPELPADKAGLLKQELETNRDRFTSGNLENLGDHDEHIHPIETGDKKLRPVSYYRTAPKIQREMDSQIQLLLKYGIIEPSRSEWRSPVVMVKKKDGTYRFACDYRRLNDLTEKQSYPMPRLEDIWDLIGETKPKYFSTLDLASGFWQIRMDPATKHKASFVTRSGQFTWNRLPFGLKNSPITFQQTMNDVLRDLITKCCIVYVDDIIVFSHTFEEHLEHLRQIFDRLRKANLTLKLSKCTFASQRVKYLGHILSTKGIFPDPDKVHIVQSWQPPKNPKQIRQFLGLTNYYRRFIPNYANIAKPMHNLTKKDQPWEWSTKCQEAFEKLRDSLITPPCLAYPDMNKPFILTTDASGWAISYILSQEDEEGVEHPISYAGRALRNAEVNYGITDKEGLAIVEGFQHFHTYLYGNVTTVITDHSALVYITNNTKLTGRVARWAILLQNYTYTVIHRKGTANTNADALSRIEVQQDPTNDGQKVEEPETRHQDVFSVAPDPEGLIEIHEPLQIILESEDPHRNESVLPIHEINLPELQQQCPEIGPLYRYLDTGELPKDNKTTRWIIKNQDQYGMYSGILHHFYEPRTRNAHKYVKTVHQIVIPLALRPQVLSDYHDSLIGGGHAGFQRTWDAIRQKYYWPRMYQDTREYQQSCTNCQKAKYPNRRHPPLHPLPPAGVFGRWHMDFIGPFHTSADGKKYILLIVDSFSRWPEAFALPNAEAATVAQVLYSEIFTRYGAPKALVSDRGPQFMSSLVSSLCEIFSVRRSVTTPYHPQSNAVCERFNSYLEASLRAYVDDRQSDWPKMLPGILMAYRNTPANRSTEFSPYYILFGQQMKTPIDQELTGRIPDVSAQYRDNMRSVLENVSLSRKIAEENMTRHQRENKAYHDRTAQEPGFEMGDLVWLHDPRVPVGYSRKIRAQWVGPFNICEIGPNHTYRLRHAQTRQVMNNLVNANRMKMATALEDSAIRVYQRRRQWQLQQERNQRQLDRNHNVNNNEDPPAPADAPRPQQPAPRQQPPDTDGDDDEEDIQDNDPDGAGEPDPPVEKINDLSRNNKGRWFHVKFKGIPGYQWRQEGYVDIPKQMLEDILERKTWSGKARKRRRRK